jgi:hypothetical protein
MHLVTYLCMSHDVCMYVCYVCIHDNTNVSDEIAKGNVLCMYICTWTYVYVYVCMCICMYVCMYALAHVCMRVLRMYREGSDEIVHKNLYMP